MKHATKNWRVQESIRRFRCGFLQEGREKLFNALPAGELERALHEEVSCWRERFYAPLLALRLFVEQVLHADHACQDVVVRYASERAAQGEAEVSLSTGPASTTSEYRLCSSSSTSVAASWALRPGR